MNLATEDGPPAVLLFRRRVRLGVALGELWHSRRLVITLAERSLRVRYKLAVLGFLWAVLSPLVLMVVFSLFFQRIARVETGGISYPLFAYLGLIPWTFFSSSVSNAGTSILANTGLLNKIYCPREAFPLAAMCVTAVDTGASLGILALLFAIYTTMPSVVALPWVPLLLLVLVAFSLGVSLLVSGLMVYFRDLRQALPLILQLGLFATPVAYGMDLVPSRFHLLYSALNPLAPVIDGLRRTLLDGVRPDLGLTVAAIGSSTAVLLGGYMLFKHLETRFSDVA